MQKIIKNVLYLFASLTFFFLVSCKEKYPPPIGELCTTGDEGVFVCNDPRKSKGKQDYFKQYRPNYICLSPQEFEKKVAYCIDIRERLIACERGN